MRESSPSGQAFTTSRRNVLKSTLGAAGLVAFGGTAASGLAGCATKEAPKVSNAGQVKLPTYVPQTALKADLPAGTNGSPAGFFAYPANPANSVKTPPLDGDQLSAVTNLFLPPPPGVDSNKAWQEVHKRLGGTVSVQMVGSDDYDTKLSTIVAGGNLPDLMLDTGTLGLKDVPGFLDAKCQDLTAALGGDAVKAYPNLANIPTIFWGECTVAGKLYYIPIPRGVSGGAGFVHRELVEGAGLKSTVELDSPEKLKSFFKDITNSGKDRYALGASATSYYSLTTFLQTFGAPNVWSTQNGQIVSMYESPHYQEAVEFMAELRAAGYYYPGSEGWTKAQLQNAYMTGKICTMYDGFPSLANPYWPQMSKINKDFKPGLFMPPGLNGAKPTTWADNIIFAKTMLKKADDARLKKVLALMNFLAAPFGSSEYLLLNYGVEGVDYSLDAQNNPVLNDTGTRETTVPWKFIGAPPQVIYNAGYRDYVEYAYPTVKTLVDQAVKNPTTGTYSPTFSEKGTVLRKALNDTVNDIVAGRKPTSALKPAIDKWKSGGGSKMADEYTQAVALGSGSSPS